MDFSFTEEQDAIAKLARQRFEVRATPEHLSEIEQIHIVLQDSQFLFDG